MDARFYNSEDIDVERLARDLVNAYQMQGYHAQYIGNKNQMLVQLKKGGDFEAIIGMQAALSLTLQGTSGGVLAMIGQQKWLDKAAVGAVGIVALPVLWPLALTAGVGALRQASLGNQVLNMVDGLVRQQRPSVQAGPIPYQIIPQVQQQWSPPTYAPAQPQGMISAPVPQAALPAPVRAPTPPISKGLRCTHCNTAYEQGDTFCSGCGRSLISPKLYCSKCNSEVKQGASFCPKCGASTFHTIAAHVSQQRPTPPASAPVVQAAPTPVYTPPSPPVYTPPQAEPSLAPTEYYIPPTTQEPPVQPQTKITYVPSTLQEAKPTPAPQREEKVYYTPPPHLQQANQQEYQEQPARPRFQQPAQQPPPPKILSRPVSKAATAPDAPWGMLTFNDGREVQLKGERLLIGRYDHDLGGIMPEVDLGKMEGADTVSRIHAAFEHIGSNYTLTDLNSTNTTRVNNKRLEPDAEMPIDDGDTLSFGKVTCIFKKP